MLIFSCVFLCHKVKKRAKRKTSEVPLMSAEDLEAEPGSECSPLDCCLCVFMHLKYKFCTKMFSFTFKSSFFSHSIKAHPKEEKRPHRGI